MKKKNATQAVSQTELEESYFNEEKSIPLSVFPKKIKTSQNNIGNEDK